MLHYMKSLQDWFGQSVWNSMPVAKTAASFLQDFHSISSILDYKPSHIAICCISLSLQTYGIQVPITDDFDDNTIWYSVSFCFIFNLNNTQQTNFQLIIIIFYFYELKVFTKDLNRDLHWEIVQKIMEMYNYESELEN